MMASSSSSIGCQDPLYRDLSDGDGSGASGDGDVLCARASNINNGSSKAAVKSSSFSP